MSGKSDLDAKAAAGETVVEGGKGGKSLQAQKNLAEGKSYFLKDIFHALARYIAPISLALWKVIPKDMHSLFHVGSRKSAKLIKLKTCVGLFKCNKFRLGLKDFQCSTDLYNALNVLC